MTVILINLGGIRVILINLGGMVVICRLFNCFYTIRAVGVPLRDDYTYESRGM